MAKITKNTPEEYEIFGSLKRITGSHVDAFSGGFPKGPGWPNKNIHTDLEFAKSCGLSERNVSGTMFEGYLTELMIDLFGESWLREGSMSLVFVRMVNVGETLQAKAVVKSRQVEHSVVRFVMEVWCENKLGEKVVLGTASGIIAVG